MVNWQRERGENLKEYQERVVREEAEERKITIYAWIAIGAIAVLVLATMLLHAHFVYDDWTCAFARCVKVKP